MTNLPDPGTLFAPRPDGETVLRVPLADLVRRSDQALWSDGLLARAAASGLYGPRWNAADASRTDPTGRQSLRSLPFLDGASLAEMATSSKGLREALLGQPRTWVASHGRDGSPRKWLPLDLGDVAHWFDRVRRVDEVLGIGRDGPLPTVVLALNEPMPRVANAVPYLWERVDYLAGGQRLEFIIAALEMLWRNHWDRFALQKRPHWLLAPAGDALRLAEEMGPGAQQLLREPRRGLFWGMPLDGENGVRSELASAFGLEDAFSVYFSAECREMYAECPAHDGLHLWMDGAIHEIIPDGSDPAGALFVDEAAPGTTGEYVVTTFGRVLPLVRYRTGDRIQVVGTEPCACGITHPRVRFLGRQGPSERQ